MELHPTKCNICGGEVEYISNDKIYGRPFGSGYCYRCRKCGARVGTHRPRPKDALGLLANEEMREMKMKCHSIFDSHWHTKKQRKKCYKKLAEEMGIAVSNCHFGYFDIAQLNKAYEIIKGWC